MVDDSYLYDDPEEFHVEPYEDEDEVELIIEEYIVVIPFVAGDTVCFHGETYPTGGKVEEKWRDRHFTVRDVANNGWLLLSRPMNAWVRPEDCVLVVEAE